MTWALQKQMLPMFTEFDAPNVWDTLPEAVRASPPWPVSENASKPTCILSHIILFGSSCIICGAWTPFRPWTLILVTVFLLSCALESTLWGD